MGVLFVSFIGLLFFASILVLSLHYAVVLYQKQKLHNLTNQIKPVESNPILSRKTGVGFTTRDMGEAVYKHKAHGFTSLEAIAFQDRGMTTDEPILHWTDKVRQAFKNLRYQFWPQIRRFTHYIRTLFQPVYEQDEVAPGTTEIIQGPQHDADSVDSQAQNEIDDLVESVINQSKTGGTVIHANPKAPQSVVTDTFTNQEQEVTHENEVREKEERFQKLESRLLLKLKEEGMRHFDIWLELGRVYEKYNEPTKAKEIYSMVLNNASGKEKDMARDQLIAMNF